MNKKDYNYDTETYYDINSIYEIKNGKLVSYNSYGPKFYEKDKDKDKDNLILTGKIDDMEGDDKYLI